MIERDDTTRDDNLTRVRTSRGRRAHVRSPHVRSTVALVAAGALLMAACGSSGVGDEASTAAPADVDSSLTDPAAADTDAAVDSVLIGPPVPTTDAEIDSTVLETVSETVPTTTEEDSTVVSADRKPLWELGAQALVPAGTVRLPFFDGIQFELEQEREVVPYSDGIVGIRHEDDPQFDGPEVELAMVTATSDNESIRTPEDLTAALVDGVGAEMTPIGEVDTEIGPAQGFEYSGVQYPASREEAIELDNFLFAGPDWIWIPYPMGQLWIVDTERGPLVVTAEGFEGGPLLDEAIVTMNLVLETIEFADLDQPAD